MSRRLKFVTRRDRDLVDRLLGARGSWKCTVYRNGSVVAEAWGQSPGEARGRARDKVASRW